MVRFIIANNQETDNVVVEFTFQYGQIYYDEMDDIERYSINIYIPIWLDLLSSLPKPVLGEPLDLHSNMVRFIIPSNEALQYPVPLFTFQYGQIY